MALEESIKLLYKIEKNFNLKSSMANIKNK